MLPRPRRRVDPDLVRERLLALVAGKPGPRSVDQSRAAVPDDATDRVETVTVVRPSALRPVVVVLVAAALAAWLAVRLVSGPAPAPVELVPGTPVPTSSPTGPGTTVATATASAAALVVHVVGDVRRPGLVRLAPGARVADAVAAAGGLVPGGGSGELNLARPVVDGEQISVSPEAVAAPAAGGGATGADPIVDLNTATASDLDALPGVGPVLATRILEWRTVHGRFASVDQLREVSGIGARTFEQLKSRVRV